MRRDLCAYLQDVLDAANSIWIFVDGMDFEDFQSSDLVLAAVTQKFEVIGEALKQASRNFAGSLNSLPDASPAIQMRDRLAHGYFIIQANILWDVLKNDLPDLVQQVEKLKAERCN